MILSRVDFPQPLGPMIAEKLPSRQREIDLVERLHVALGEGLADAAQFVHRPAHLADRATASPATRALRISSCPCSRPRRTGWCRRPSRSGSGAFRTPDATGALVPELPVLRRLVAPALRLVGRRDAVLAPLEQGGGAACVFSPSCGLPALACCSTLSLVRRLRAELGAGPGRGRSLSTACGFLVDERAQGRIAVAEVGHELVRRDLAQIDAALVSMIAASLTAAA